ncbi:hypothetical protein EVAR_94372_1 [Eumeta japonica]|uniref:Uncharacterized protein n=1 Tax=Eumeta variegata TaxID=151549 RepID=A0A4C1TPX9_EUMVA|nr:hypothetical protein EVAR_94372_1 [Eumeta japonica]
MTDILPSELMNTTSSRVVPSSADFKVSGASGATIAQGKAEIKKIDDERYKLPETESERLYRKKRKLYLRDSLRRDTSYRKRDQEE